MLRVLAVDDEVPALEEIAYLLRQDPRIEHVSTAVGGVNALQDMVQMIGTGERLDGVFLDIRMPGLDGLDLARLIAGFPNPPRLVFVTAHEDCAVRAFELEAVDYLLKPVRADRLAEAVRRLEYAAPAPVAEPVPEDVIPVELAGRTRFVPQQAVWYAEAKGDYVRLHTDEGSYLVRMPLAALERRWAGSGFIRVHRSTLVAVRHVSELRFDGGRVTLRVGTETLPVSRRHTRQVRERLVRQFRDRPDVPGVTGLADVTESPDMSVDVDVTDVPRVTGGTGMPTLVDAPRGAGVPKAPGAPGPVRSRAVPSVAMR